MATLTHAQVQEKRRLMELRSLAENDTFLKFIFELWREAGMDMPSHNPANAYDTSYREGRRSLGLEVLHKLIAVRPDIRAAVDAAGHRQLVTSNPQPSQEDDEDEQP